MTLWLPTSPDNPSASSPTLPFRLFPLQPWNTVREYVKWHWPALAFRLFACTMGFLLWWNNTAFFDALVSNQLGVSVGLQKSIPLTPATAGIYGLLSDVLLDWA